MTNFFVPSLASVYAQLTNFANLGNFWSLFDTVFGSSYDLTTAVKFKLQWQNGSFSQFPQIEVVSNSVLGTANGAYAISTNKIYLSDSFISTASQQSLEAVILEEFGHFVDAQVNTKDTAGDEGELFSALVRGVSLSASELSRIKTEDDHAIAVIDGQQVAIEQANPEFKANTYTTGEQDKANVTALAGGGFLVVWESTGQDGNLDGIYGQRYDNNQLPVGSEFRANTTITNNQRNPVSVGLSGGGYVIAWQSTNQDGSNDGIYGQRFNSNGTLAGSEFQINTQTVENQWLPALSALNNGGFVAVWQSWLQDGNNWGVFGKRFDSNGNPDGTEFQVNTYTTGNQTGVDVETLNDGSFVVAWESNGQDSGTVGIYGQRFDSNGVALGNEFLINTYSPNNQTNPAISKLDNGGFVVVWESIGQVGQDGSSLGIYGQRFDSNGNFVGSEFLVNTYTTNTQSAPSVSPLSNGGFAVTWESSGQDGSSWGVYGKSFGGNGNPLNTETLINTQTANAQSDPSIALLTGGKTVVLWQSLNQESSASGYGIYGKVLNTPPTVQADKTIAIGIPIVPINLGITVPIDIDGDPLTVTVGNIPDPTYGVIKLGATTITTGSVLLPSDLPNLVFEGDPTGIAQIVSSNNTLSLYTGLYTDFSYRVSDGSYTTTQAVALANLPPDLDFSYQHVPFGDPNGSTSGTGNGFDLSAAVSSLPLFIDPEGYIPLSYSFSDGGFLPSGVSLISAGGIYTLNGYPNLSTGLPWAWGYILVTATDNLGLSSSGWLAVLFNDQFGVYGLCLDNYIADATVFFDVNNNGILDSGELSTTTDENGLYGLALPETLDLNSNGKLDPNEGMIVAFGGIDTATGLALETPLRATPDATVVTLLSTVLAKLVDQGLTVAEANTKLSNALSLPANVRINSFDPIFATKNNQPGGVATFAAMVKVQNLITQITGLLDGASSVANAEIVNNVVGAITNQIQSSNTLNLTNTTQLQTIIQSAATSTGVTLSADRITGAAQIVAESNQRIDTLATNSPANTLEQGFAKVQKIALDGTTKDLKEVGAGTKTIADVVAGNTGATLNTKITNAKVFSADPTDITLNNASVFENQPINTEVGKLTSLDADSTNFTYSLVAGAGDTDNAKFQIVGDKIVTKEVFDYETKNSYSIQILTSDGDGGVYSEQFTINITNVDEQRSLILTPQQDIFNNEGLDDTVTGTFANLKQNDNINGGAGIDTLILSGGTSTDEINIDASDTTNQLDILGSTITNFERFDLSEFLGNVSIVGIDNTNNWLKTGSGKDDLTGGKGNDTLNGGTGADILIGLKGNDTYVVDNTGDIIIENLNSGIDTVESSISWTLKANLENLTLTGTSAINGTGNNLNNTIVGNSANNVINGSAGIDTLTGGAGNDTFVVDTVTDLIDGGVGTDTIQSSVTFSLANALVSNVENLTLTGTANINGTGNVFVNTITGNTGNNILDGGTGNDILSGGIGNDTLNGGIDKDTLTGGVGIDTFVFQFGQSLVSNSDRITDFGFGTDKIDLLTQTGLAITAPTNFSRAANSTATTLQNLVNSVFTDANGAITGNQVLEVNSAALVQVTTAGIAGSYLVINDDTAGFQSNNDLLINITGYSGTLPALGAISVNSFFV